MNIGHKEIFIPGPSGRIQAKYFKNKQQGAPAFLPLIYLAWILPLGPGIKISLFSFLIF